MDAETSLPALLGGTPIRPEGPPAWPVPDADVAEALARAYRDGDWGRYHGPNVSRLEARLGATLGLSYATVCASGTLAVEIALRAVAVSAGDEVVLAGYDYLGNFLGIHALGAMPSLVDIDPITGNLDVARLADAITPKTRALLVSHLHGGVVDMAKVMALSKERGVAVVEDAAQMPGASLRGRRLGSFGDVGVVSFGGSKLLTAGRGGALVTGDAKIHQRVRSLLQRGNNLLSPLSELQAAVLLPQLDKLDARRLHRAKSVACLADLVAKIPGLRLFANALEDVDPDYYKLGMFLDEVLFGLDRKTLTQAMRAEGIALDEGFAGVHVGRSPNRYKNVGGLAVTESAHRSVVTLHHPVLLGARGDVEQVVLALEKVRRFAEALSERQGVEHQPEARARDTDRSQ